VLSGMLATEMSVEVCVLRLWTKREPGTRLPQGWSDNTLHSDVQSPPYQKGRVFLRVRHPETERRPEWQ